jgi:hypothetical protein
MSDIRKQIASSIFRTAIAYERAEMDGLSTNGLATQINNLRDLLVEATADKVEFEVPMTPEEQAALRDWFWEGTEPAGLNAIPRQPQPQVEIDGDVLFA